MRPPSLSIPIPESKNFDSGLQPRVSTACGRYNTSSRHSGAISACRDLHSVVETEFLIINPKAFDHFVSVFHNSIKEFGSPVPIRKLVAQSFRLLFGG